MLVIVRGLPGSGKTTYAKYLAKLLREKGHGVSHFENDMYFVDGNGNYKYEDSKKRKSIEWCLANMALRLVAGDIVIVSCVFSRFRQITRLLEVAGNLDLPVEIYRCTGEYNSTHNVPKAIVENMRANFEDIVNEIKV